MLIPTDDRPVALTRNLEPIALDTVKRHLRFGTSIEDPLITIYLVMARTFFEEKAGRQCLNAEFEYGLAGPPDQGYIEVPRPPLHPTGVTVTYDDSAGVARTFSAENYRVVSSIRLPDDEDDPVEIDPFCARGRIELVSGAAWPTTRTGARSLRIRRTCGYGATPDAMPPMIQGILLMLTGHFFRNREAVISGTSSKEIEIGAEAMIASFKYSALPTLPPPHRSVWNTNPLDPLAWPRIPTVDTF